MTDKNKTISKIYKNPSGYGSIKNTFNEASQKDSTIRVTDVKEWFGKNVEQKTKHTGRQNSDIAKKPLEEFQCDIFSY
jgi:hypothetical protein